MVKMRSLLQKGIEESADMVNDLIRAQDILKYLIDEHENVDGYVCDELVRVSELIEKTIKKL